MVEFSGTRRTCTKRIGIYATYDAYQVWEQSKELGHAPIFDRNPICSEPLPMALHEARRYNERSAVEQVNGRLKDEFGGRKVMVRGAEKVMLYMMFGVVSLFADHLLKFEAD